MTTTNKLNGTVQKDKIPDVDPSSASIGTPKYKYDINVKLGACKWWQFIPSVEQQPMPKFWSIILDDKDTIEVNLNVRLPSSKCKYDAMYLRFHNATIRNIPVGSQDIGAFWIYRDGKPMLNPHVPQYFAAPAYNPTNPDWSWGSIVIILFDGDNIKPGLTKYDLVYRGKNPFNPKSFELHVINGQEGVC